MLVARLVLRMDELKVDVRILGKLLRGGIVEGPNGAAGAAADGVWVVKTRYSSL